MEILNRHKVIINATQSITANHISEFLRSELCDVLFLFFIMSLN